MKRIANLLAIAAAFLPLPALAWGFEGHQVVADIARADLTRPCAPRWTRCSPPTPTR